jgi:hypothetical protein
MLWRTIDLLGEGHPQASRYLMELRGALHEGDFPAIGYVVAAIDVMHDIREGDLNHAEGRAKECLEHGFEVRDPNAFAWYGAHMVAIRWFQGRIAELVAMLRELVCSPMVSLTDSSYVAALAVALAAAGERREALGALGRVTGRGLSAIPRSSGWLATIYAVGEAAHLLGERELASEVYQALLPHAHLPVMAGPGVACFGSVQHALGLAALTGDRVDGAVEHLRAAVAENMALGNWPAAALSRYRLSVALGRCPDADRRAEARTQREVAENEAGRLGMELTASVAGETEIAGGVTCVRRGRRWRIGFESQSVQVDHCLGMTYLAVLFANPGQDISAAELTTGPRTAETSVAVHRARSTRHAVLDQRALSSYKERLAVLQTEIDRCDATGDQERAIEAHRERDWILAQLRTATGLGGRVRSFPTNDERARIAVGKAIRRALDRIDAANPTLGAILIPAVRTGRHCVYTPPTPDRRRPSNLSRRRTPGSVRAA